MYVDYIIGTIIVFSSIAGLQRNSIKIPHTQVHDTQILLMNNFNLLHGAHSSRRFYASKGITQGAIFLSRASRQAGKLGKDRQMYVRE